MKVVLEFGSDGKANVYLAAQSEAEQAILGFLNHGRQLWVAEPQNDYRYRQQPEALRLVPFAPMPPAATG